MSLRQLEQKIRILGTPVVMAAKDKLLPLEKVFSHSRLLFDTIPLRKWNELLGGINTLQACRQGKLTLDQTDKDIVRLTNYYRSRDDKVVDHPTHNAIQKLLDGTMEFVRWENDVPTSNCTSVTLSFQPTMSQHKVGKPMFDGRWFISATIETPSDIWRDPNAIGFRARFLMEINQDVLRNKIFSTLLSDNLSEKTDAIIEEKERLAKNKAKANLIKALLKGE